MFSANGRQRAGLDAVPASHAHVLKNHGRFKSTVDLFDHFVGAGRQGRANSPFGVTLLGIAPFIIYRCKGFFGWHAQYNDPYECDVGWPILLPPAQKKDASNLNA